MQGYLHEGTPVQLTIPRALGLPAEGAGEVVVDVYRDATVILRIRGGSLGVVTDLDVAEATALHEELGAALAAIDAHVADTEGRVAA